MSKNQVILGAVILAIAAALAIVSHQEPVHADTPGASTTAKEQQGSIQPAYRGIADASGTAPSTATPTSASKAASAQFERHKLCLLAWQGEQFFMENPNQKDWYLDQDAAFKGLTAQQRIDREKLLKGWEALFDAMERAKTECSDLRGRLEDGSIYADALAAAKLGDQRAANCYVSLAFPMPDSMRSSEKRAAEYRKNATQLIKQGIEQGNWTMVLLAIEAENGEERTWIRGLSAFDPAILLRLLTLQALGAPETATRDQYRKIADMQKANTPADKVASAEQWAQNAYRKYFSRSPHLNREIPFCH